MKDFKVFIFFISVFFLKNISASAIDTTEILDKNAAYKYLSSFQINSEHFKKIGYIMDSERLHFIIEYSEEGNVKILNIEEEHSSLINIKKIMESTALNSFCESQYIKSLIYKENFKVTAEYILSSGDIYMVREFQTCKTD